MGIFDILFNKKRDNQRMKHREEFDIEAYNNFNNSKIPEFINKYDLNTVEGIRSVPISEAIKYKDVNQSVVYMPEQILMRKATEYEKKIFNINFNFNICFSVFCKCNWWWIKKEFAKKIILKSIG